MNSLEILSSARKAFSEIASIGAAGSELVEAVPMLHTSTAHLWCCWLSPPTPGTALLVNGSWNLSAFALCGWYRSVHVMELDEARAACYAGVAERLGLAIVVETLSPLKLASKLHDLASRHYDLVAVQDVFDDLPRSAEGDCATLFQAMQSTCSRAGQSAIVSGGRFVLDGRRLLRHPGRPTPRTWRNESPALTSDVADWIYFHPNHHTASEVLGPHNPLPATRRRQWTARLLNCVGAIEPLLGGYAAITPRRVSDRIVDQWSRTWPGASDTPGKIKEAFVRDGEMLFMIMDRADVGQYIVRAPLTLGALESLRRADAAVDSARTIPIIRELVPPSVPVVSAGGWPVGLELVCPGVPARQLIDSVAGRRSVRRAVEAIVEAFAVETARHQVVDAEFFGSHWGDRFDAVVATHPELAEELRRMRDRVLRQVLGRKMTTMRIHGDLTPNNLFLDPVSGTASGLIDWETSQPESLPFDCTHYLVSEAREREGLPWGQCVARALAGMGLDGSAREMLLQTMRRLEVELDLLPSVLIGYWIRGVALRQSLAGGTLRAEWRKANLEAPLSMMRTIAL